jgi:hypothetical protein
MEISILRLLIRKINLTNHRSQQIASKIIDTIITDVGCIVQLVSLKAHDAVPVPDGHASLIIDCLEAGLNDFPRVLVELKKSA